MEEVEEPSLVAGDDTASKKKRKPRKKKAAAACVDCAAVPSGSPFIIKKLPVLGRHAVATRDIEAGELILSEQPCVMPPTSPYLHLLLPLCPPFLHQCTRSSVALHRSRKAFAMPLDASLPS